MSNESSLLERGLTIRAASQPVSVPVHIEIADGSLTPTGRFVIKPSAFGIKPISVSGRAPGSPGRRRYDEASGVEVIARGAHQLHAPPAGRRPRLGLVAKAIRLDAPTLSP